MDRNCKTLCVKFMKTVLCVFVIEKKEMLPNKMTKFVYLFNLWRKIFVLEVGSIKLLPMLAFYRVFKALHKL